jgi:hypothetical protein
MSLYQSVEEFKQEADTEYRRYLTNFIYRGLLNIFPNYKHENQLIVISELIFLAIEQDENSSAFNYFKRIVEYSTVVIKSLPNVNTSTKHFRYIHLINDLYHEALQETVFYFTNKDMVFSGSSIDMFYD